MPPGLIRIPLVTAAMAPAPLKTKVPALNWKPDVVPLPCPNVTVCAVVIFSVPVPILVICWEEVPMALERLITPVPAVAKVMSRLAAFGRPPVRFKVELLSAPITASRFGMTAPETVSLLPATLSKAPPVLIPSVVELATPLLRITVLPMVTLLPNCSAAPALAFTTTAPVPAA